jgi:hypothetical protein
MEQHCVLQIWKEMLGHKDYTIAQVNRRTLTPYPAEVIEIDIDGRTFWVRPVGSWVLQSNNVVADALAVSLDKPLEWATGFFFGNTELSLELWNIISGHLRVRLRKMTEPSRVQTLRERNQLIPRSLPTVEM